jgi:hypothetical protein
MPRSLVGALAVAILLTLTPLGMPSVRAQGPGTDAVVVDDRDAGFTPRGFGWHDGDGGYAGEHYWQFAVHGRRGGQVGVWRATFPEPGRYTVQARIPPRHATTTAARYRIQTTGGFVKRTVDQAGARGTWVRLGTFELRATTQVRLSARTGDPSRSRRMVAFDAVRFMPQVSVSGPVIRAIQVEPGPDRAVVTFSLDAPGPARTEYRQAGTDEWIAGPDETSSRYADHSQVIRDLSPATDYELRVIATDDDGTTTSEIVPFTTTAT